MCLCANLGSEDWGGGRVRSSQFPGGLTPQGTEVPPQKSEICPPHLSQLPPGAGEGGTGRPGPRRTPAKGRKAGGDEGGRKKLGGAMGNPGGSLGGDWEGEEDGDAERRPLELRRLLLSGEVVALLSGEGSGCTGAGRVAFPLKISMTFRLRATMSGVSL